MDVTLNSREIRISSESELGVYLEEIDNVCKAEAWMYSESGSSICMLKNDGDMFLMYLEHPEDDGVVSVGKFKGLENIEFELANGQVDEYPKSWCLGSESALKGLAYFYINNGLKSEYIDWQKA
ncbi:hypothetical protein L1D15_21340 [Vibrio sp. Isolate25]|uniref:hypothetical protein n=1 Tax=Vibrio sp. Isolate25 TaxID=2908535 RepID=UPI001EFE1529|nr:hypothetical protein [Vibrio sp. Isolate25]MCG9599237.1 hypothetical protein [Vibrio sp. Isolate25]